MNIPLSFEYFLCDSFWTNFLHQFNVHLCRKASPIKQQFVQILSWQHVIYGILQTYFFRDFTQIICIIAISAVELFV